MAAKKKRKSLAGPLVLVGGLSRKRNLGSWKKSWTSSAEKLLGRARHVPSDLAKVAGGQLPKQISKHVPSRRKRRKLVKKLRHDVERLSGIASGLSSVLGVAAAGSELLSVLRQRDEERGSGSYDDSSADEEEQDEVDDDESDEEEPDGEASSGGTEEESGEGDEGDVKSAEDQSKDDQDDQSEVRMRRAS